MARFSKEDLFIDQYIHCKFNGAEAVRHVYNIGGKGGRTDLKASTARTMAAQLLAKLSVRKRIRKKIEANDVGIPVVFNLYKRIAESHEHDPMAAIAALDRLAYIMGIDVYPPKAGRTRTDKRRVEVQLVSPV